MRHACGVSFRAAESCDEHFHRSSSQHDCPQTSRPETGSRIATSPVLPHLHRCTTFTCTTVNPKHHKPLVVVG